MTTFLFNEEKPMALLDTICNLLSISRIEMLSPKRGNRDSSDKRHVAMWCYKKLTPYSYPQIGRVFNKHYTTVIHACGRVDYYVEHPHFLEKHNANKRPNIGHVALDLLYTLDPPDNIDQLSFDLTSN